jgi:serine/threonine protein kinase
MTKLGDFYSDFIRIDLDSRGGYSRVAQVKTNEQNGFPRFCAFKVMRHENDRISGLERFENEISLLINITTNITSPPAITRIYDCGFVPVGVSDSLHKKENPDLGLEIHSSGLDIKDFLRRKSELLNRQDNGWLPYLVVELAPYDDSLLRQIHSQPQEDPSGLFRFPTGEVIALSLQLLDVMKYLHTKHNRAYMDWKPEHIYWNGQNKQVKLIDWNVTSLLDEGPGKRQNILDDIRIFCGAALYIGLTFIDPDDPTKPIGPRPTQELASPVPEIRRRYWTDTPNFYQRDVTLDERIKNIIRTGLDPKQGFESIEQLKTSLLEYASEEYGLLASEVMLQSQPISPYFMALTEVHQAEQHLLSAQHHLYEAVGQNGSKLEFTRLFDSIKRALQNFPIS